MTQLDLLKLPIPVVIQLNVVLLLWAIAMASKTGEPGKPMVAVLVSQLLTLALIGWVIVFVAPRITS
jgi:hypothetical protein